MESAPAVPAIPARYCHRCQTPLASWAKGSTCPACMMTSSSAFGGGALSLPVAQSVAGENGALDQPLVFGDYLLEKQINHGGMGVVYRARQLSLNRVVAVKLLLLGRYSSEESRLRFRREAQSAAKLRHPNIVAVYEVGECDDQPFIAMEFVDGGSLAERLREGPMPAREAAELIKVVAGAIQYAHQHGVMHRDVKPSNLLVAADGGVHVTDFGLAKQIDGTSDVTLSGRMLGTPNYLPPEAIGGNSASFGAQGDVYSLGAVLYETLTGRPPFLSGSLPDTLRRIAETDPVALRTLNPAVPRDLETICLKALAKDPGRRFPTPKALADELGRWLANEPIQTRRAGWPERLVKWARRKPAIATLTSLTVLGATATISTLLVSYQRVSEEQLNAEEAQGKAEKAQGKAETESAAHVRTLIHYLTLESENLVRQFENHSGLLRLVEALQLDEKPSGQMMHRRRIAGNLLTAPKLKGLWMDDNYASLARFSPDGKKLAFVSETKGIGVFDGHTGETLTEFKPWAGRDKAIEVWLVNEGKAWVLDGASRLHQVSANTLEPLGTVIETGFDAQFRTYGPGLHFNKTGTRFITTLKGGGARLFSAVSGTKKTGRLAAGNNLTCARINENGGIAALAGGKRVFVIDTATGATKCEFEASGDVTRLELNATGTRLLVCAQRVDKTHRERKLEWWNLEKPVPEMQWSRHASGEIFDARISPDDKFVSAGTALGEFFLLEANSPLAAREPVILESPVWCVPFSASSRTVATTCEDGSVRVWDIPARKQKSPTLNHGDLIYHAQFSPDGNSFVTVGREQIVRLWNRSTEPEDMMSVGWPNLAGRKSFHPDGDRFFTAAGKMIFIWNGIGKGRSEAPVRLEHASAVQDAVYSPDGSLILSGCDDGSIYLWDAVKKERILLDSIARRGMRNQVTKVNFSSDGSMFLAAGANGVVRRRGTRPGFPLMEPDWEHAGEIKSAAFRPGGKEVLTASRDLTVMLRDAETGAQLMASLMEWEPGDAAFDDQGRRFAVAGWDATREARPAQLWDVATRSPVGPPMFQSDGLNEVSFSHDGKIIATTGEEGRIMLWEAGSGRHLSTLPGSRDRARRARFSPDGDMIVTFGDTSGPQVWEVATGDPVTAPLPASGIFNCDWSRDGNYLQISTGGQSALWKLTPVDGSVERLRMEAEVLSCQRLDGMSGLLPLAPREILERWTALKAASPAADAVAKK